PWQYDKAMYRRRNEIERLFRRLKGFRRIFSRFDKLDAVFLAFLHFPLIVERLRYLISVNTPEASCRNRAKRPTSAVPRWDCARVSLEELRGLLFKLADQFEAPNEALLPEVTTADL